jgi:bilin biosynthesis protein
MTIDSLFEQLKHPNPHMREQAMWGIVEVRDENTIPRLMQNLGDEDVVYRRASVKTLGYIGPDSVPSLVEELSNSDNVTVKASCAKALAQVAVNHADVPFPAEGIDGLKISMHDSNPVVNIASVMALGEIGQPAVDILIDALQTTDNPALAVAIVNALAAIGGDRASEVLTALTQDASVDTYVQESAVSALSRLDLLQNYRRPE